MAAPAKGIRLALRALRHRDFAIVWSGAFISNTGTWLTNLTVPYVLYQITHSAWWVGMVSLAQFLPGILLGPAGGFFADRYERRRILMITQSGMALAALLMWGVWVSGVRNPAAILLVVATGGFFVGVNMPSWQSFVNDLVPREDLLSAITLNSLQYNMARSLGPAIAGILLAAFGPGWAFLLNAISFVFVLGALSLVRPRHRQRTVASSGGVTRQFVEALRYLRTQPGIQMGLMISMLVGAVGNPLFQFTVVFAGSVFHAGPIGLGLLNVALGVGAILAAPVVSGRSHALRMATLVRWGLVLYGLSIIAFGLAPDYAMGVVALVAVGGCFLAVVSVVNTSTQLIVADYMRGRVLAFRIMIFTVSVPVGALVQGWLYDWVGPRSTVIGAGAVLLITAAVLSRLRGRARLDRLDDPHDTSPQSGTALAASH